MHLIQSQQRKHAVMATQPMSFNAQATSRLESEDDFRQIQVRFGSMGGTWTADYLAGHLQETSVNGIGFIARSIVDRKLINIFWGGTYWLPAFQFMQPSLEIRPSISSILLELTPVMNDWHIALWFSSPNQWLKAISPAELITNNFTNVLDAARAQRFLEK